MSTTMTWEVFEDQLAAVLSVLEDDQFLIVSATRGWVYVQFNRQAGHGIRGEAVSNKFLSPDQHLSAADMTALATLGWLAPTDTVPNFYQGWAEPVESHTAAKASVRTLREVYVIDHPGQLQYKAFHKAGDGILLPTLGVERTPPKAPATPPTDAVEDVRRRVLSSLRTAWESPDLEFTGEQHHIEVRFGSAIMFIRVLENPVSISVGSPLLLNVSHREGLLERINELNRRLRFAHLFVEDDTVCAEIEVFATPFVNAHLMQACERLGQLADALDDLLQEEFGGRTAFGEFRATGTVH